MKNIIIATAISFGIASSAWAAQTTMPEMDMNQHQQAVITHDSVENSNSDAHQKMVDMHTQMMGNQAQSANKPQSFSNMNEHEQAMIVHENMNNSDSYAHEKIVENHKKMIETPNSGLTPLQ